MQAQLDGYTIEVEAGGGWASNSGTAPFKLDLELDREAAVTLFEAATIYGSTLTLLAGADSQEFKRLTIVGLAPTTNPSTQTLTVVDPRWTLPYTFVAGHFNVRRKTPLKSRSEVVGADLPPDASTQLTVVDDDIAYARWSLNRGVEAYTVREVAAEVLDQAYGPGNWTTRDNVFNTSTIPVENWSFNVQGDAAVGKLLSYLGGAVGVTNGDDGVAVFYNTQGEGELAQLGLTDGQTSRTRDTTAALLPLVGSLLFELQDRRRERPSVIRVLFDRLVEARINASESDPTGSTQTRTRQAAELLRCVNVFPLPEDGTINGVPQIVGTWVSLDDYLTFLAEQPNGNPLAARLPLTRERVRKLWLSNAINSYAVSTFDPSGVWRRRIGVLQQHYRKTYRVSTTWNDRIKAYQPYRVGIASNETGARPPALAYLDYCVVKAWTPLGLGYDSVDEELFNLTQNRYAFDGGGSIIGNPLANLRPAPAEVRVLDQDQGIIQVNLVTDFTGIADRYVRSATVLESTGGQSRYATSKVLLADTDLSTDHEVSILLTIVPGAPNDKRRFYPVEVSVSEAEKLLPGNVSRSRQGEGPVLEVRYGHARGQARFAWNDAYEEEFLEAFSERSLGAALPSIGDPVNLGQLTKLAQAVALSEYMRFRDHNEGALTTAFRPGVVVDGTISRVLHEVTAGGGATTTVELLSDPPAVDAQSLLPPNVRAVIEGYVEP